MKPYDAEIRQLYSAMQSADYILIGAGAGLSAAAGLSYADETLFQSRYPYWAARGRHSEYHMFSFRDWSKAQEWAYMADHVHRVMAETPPLPLYQKLKALLQDKNYYILTSNVDRQFLRNQFSPERLFEYQGSYDLLCCSQPCSDRAWPFAPDRDRILRHINRETMAAESEYLPVCPYCGAPARMAFRDYPQYAEEKSRYDTWLKQSENGMLCIIEIGVGFNSPGVIRVPFERITGEREQIQFFRITADYIDSDIEIAYPEIPVPIADKSCSINLDAALVLEQLKTMTIKQETNLSK